MRRAPLPTLWVPAAQAVTVASHGPRKPYRIDTSAAARLPIIIGTRNGLTRRGPFSISTWIWVSRVSRPPTPVPMITPDPVRVGLQPPRQPPASASASAAATAANWVKRSTRRSSLGPYSGVASRSTTWRIPDGAGPSRPAQNASRPIPHGATTPSPVTATRRPGTAPVPSGLAWTASIRAWR